MFGCPFYGFRWPARSATLQHVGGNECGLELETNEICAMEKDGRPVDFFVCPTALGRKPILDAAKHLILFDSGAGEPDSLVEWERLHRR
jgi:hypothetical protein